MGLSPWGLWGFTVFAVLQFEISCLGFIVVGVDMLICVRRIGQCKGLFGYHFHTCGIEGSVGLIMFSSGLKVLRFRFKI